MFQFKLAASLVGDGSAQHTASVAQHIVHGFGRNEFGRHDEVALVFTVLIVDNDDELSGFEVLEGFFHGGYFEIFHVDGSFVKRS